MGKCGLYLPRVCYSIKQGDSLAQPRTCAKQHVDTLCLPPYEEVLELGLWEKAAWVNKDIGRVVNVSWKRIHGLGHCLVHWYERIRHQAGHRQEGVSPQTNDITMTAFPVDTSSIRSVHQTLFPERSGVCGKGCGLRDYPARPSPLHGLRRGTYLHS